MRGEVAATLDMEGKRRAVVEKHTFGGEDGVAVKMPTCSGELGEEDGGAGVGVVVTAESNLLKRSGVCTDVVLNNVQCTDLTGDKQILSR